ncbi:hypothetical protein [Morganella morganii]|uniref:Uncharacterized protein n=1 Tax=Morganella morganii TaxID=582 RepID=A0A1W6JPI9_MORMO|nr:hypothetical protein [Morganella morganii]
MSREILTLKKSNKAITIQADTSAPKSTPVETQQEAPQQPQKKNRGSREEAETPYRPDSAALACIHFTGSQTAGNRYTGTDDC